jgi:hypothetical protein
MTRRVLSYGRCHGAWYFSRSGYRCIEKRIHYIFKGIWRSTSLTLMEKLNSHIYEIFTSLFATGYYALLNMETSTVELCKGGHMHPLIWKSADSNSLMELNLPGPGLGIIPKAKFESMTIEVKKGDKMLFFTDGIIEQRNKKVKCSRMSDWKSFIFDSAKMIMTKSFNRSMKNSMFSVKTVSFRTMLLCFFWSFKRSEAYICVFH